MLHSFTGIEELELEKQEAEKMAAALKGVADQYDVKPTEKTLAWTNLITTSAMIYGTRVFAFRLRKKAEKDAGPPKPERPPGQVTPLFPG